MLPMVFTLTKPLQQTLIVGVVNLRNTGEGASSYNLMIAGASIAIIPMLLVYLFLNRYFISDLHHFWKVVFHRIPLVMFLFL